jgi:hypothetical protein
MVHAQTHTLLSLEQLSRLTRKSFRTVRSRLEGIKPAKRTKTAILYAAPVALAAIYAADHRALPADAPVSDLKRRKLQLEVEDLELTLGAKRHALVEMDKALAVVAADYAAVRSRLLGVPTKCAPIVLTMTELEPVRGVLQDAIEDALAELSSEDALVSRLGT